MFLPSHGLPEPGRKSAKVIVPTGKFKNAD
jgi:hypothetical protein